ncbi:hypothetical protein TRFO_15739 [Tritrichomonas foetus]|uniref:Uncharacterized protein n=1 Tax=Tritrichomonas foetus TaxID=1144522 RepID=A0A1J4KSV7_9EUKA|nr:hypothetical protein TRFO_15739 [Tritrichomonas foetus]|eukprot:OHT13968.1 hypothetical protein TRFO_15739 [Tritrichomonas foetus]
MTPDGVVTPPISSIRTHDSQSQPAAQNLNFSSNPNISPAVTKNVTPNNQPVKPPFIFPSNSALLGPPSITTNTANQISAQSLFRETSDKSQPPRFPPFIEQYMRPNMHTNLSNSSIYPPQKQQGQQSSRSLE